MCEGMFSGSPEKDARFPEVEVTGDHELNDVGSGDFSLLQEWYQLLTTRPSVQPPLTCYLKKLDSVSAQNAYASKYIKLIFALDFIIRKRTLMDF